MQRWIRFLPPPLENHSQHDLACRQMSGFGTALSFHFQDGKTEAFHLLDNLSLIDISNNLLDSKLPACHPYTTTHSSLSGSDLAAFGITNADLRLSIGFEAMDDLIGNLHAELAVLG